MLRRSKRVCKSKTTVENSPQEPPSKRKRNYYSGSSDSESLFVDDSSGDEFDPTPTKETKEPCELNLSESDSDNDTQGSIKPKLKTLQQSDTESEDGDKVSQTNFDFTSILEPQDTKAANDTESNTSAKTVDHVEDKSRYDNIDVAKVLSMGEGVNLGTVLNDTDNIVEENIKRDDNYTIPNMVEVTVKLPNDIKCKKGQDMQNLLRRRMNTICKETQVLIHKVNLLLWISYGNHLNSVLNSPEVMASALSLVPSKNAYPPKQCDLNYLENYMKWFSKKIKVASKTDPLTEITVKSLIERFSTYEAKTQFELIAMFISMLRSLGLNVRLVINLNAVPIKPTSEQLLGVLTDEDHTKPSTSKSKVETIKTPSKSEYFNKKPKKSENNRKKQDTKNSKKSNEKTKSGNKKSKSNESNDEIISSTDEEDDIFVEKKNAKSEYFDKKSNKPQTDSKKSNAKTSKTTKSVSKNKNKNSKLSEKIDRRVLSTDEEDHTSVDNSETITKKKVKNDFWAEVFLEMEEKWFCVDVIGQRLHCIKEIYVSWYI